MKCNEAGLDIIRRYEGLRLQPYQDTGGVWTVGYGSTRGVSAKSPPITEQEAEDLLRLDVASAEKDITRKVSVPLNENQFSALVSLVFNIGGTNFRKSTMRALINRKWHDEAANQFPRWVYDNGRKLGGLVKRREEERALYLKPVAKS
jgi:lysozyme